MGVSDFLKLQYEKRRASLSLERMLSGAISFPEWQSGVRGALKQSLGDFPEAFPALDIRELETVDMPGVDMTLISYTSEEGLETPAYCLRSKGEKGDLPAIVAITGHGYGHRDCVGLAADGSIDLEGDYVHNFALKLCEKGFAVIAPEPLGFGRLRLDAEMNGDDPNHSSCDGINGFLTMMGRSLGGVRVVQAQRAIDALAHIGGVRMDKVGMMGISGGGLVTAFAAALDERIAACVVSGYSNTFIDSVMSLPHCVDNFFPGLVKDVELPDILASIAPRFMLWEAGDEDPIFPFHAVKKAYAQVGRVYESQGVSDRLDLDAFKGGHMISGKKAYDFLWRALGE